MNLGLLDKGQLGLIEIDLIVEEFSNEDIDKMLRDDPKRIGSMTYTCPTSFLICC